MKFFWRFSFLVAFLCSNVLSEKVHLVEALVRRQIFSTLPTSCTGTTCQKTSSSSSLKSSSTKSSSLSSITSTTSSVPSSKSSSSTKVSTVSSTTSSSVSYNQYAVTTTFTQPPSCTGGLTYVFIS